MHQVFHNRLIFFGVLCCIVILAFTQMATAALLPLTTEHADTVSGDLYVGSFQPVPFVNQPTSGVTSRDFDQAFTIPTFTNIQWARVYVNVYSGTGSGDWPTRTTTTLDANGDGTYETVLGVENMTTGTSYSTDGTVYWINDHTNRVYSDYETSYDVTNLIASSHPAVHVKNEKIGTGSYDGRLKAVTLVVAYNDGDSDTVKYWVNHGHDWINSGSSSTTFGTAGIPTGFTGATLSNVALSSVDGTYTFGSTSLAGADPVSPINYYENHTWSVTGAVNPAADSVFQYALGTGPSFKTTLAALSVRYPAQELADLQVTALACNLGAGAYLFANEPNLINVTVKNNGTAAAGASTLNVDVAGTAYTASVGTLDSGASQTVTVTDTVSRTNGTIVKITATAEGGKYLVSNQTVYNNGYKGKRFTGGSDMNTHAGPFEGQYGVVYSTGNSAYNSVGWTEKTYSWTPAQLPIPTGATIKSARLYQAYTWDQTPGGVPNWTMTVNGLTVSPTATYLDTKGWGIYGDYEQGLYVYDVTSQFNTTGNSITITPQAENKNGIYGAYIVVVYQDTATAVRKIWINDECDILASKNTFSVTSDEATAYANFIGVDTSGVTSAQAIAIIASANEADKSKFFWNGNEYTGFWSNYQSEPQLGFSPFDVTGALSNGANTARIQSYDSGSGGDNMYAQNVILIIEKSTTSPDLVVTSISPNVGAGAFLFANEPNLINVTVKNNGTAAASASTLNVDVAGTAYTASVGTLDSGASQNVTVIDTISRTNGTVVRINATAEGGKFLVSDQTVYNNGYKGKRWTGGSDMNTQVSFDGRYGIRYSAGDTVYAGASWTTKTFNWSATDLPIPASATVVSARLYQGYSYNKMTTAPAFTMAFNSNTVTPVATYLDRKSFGTYDYPYGLYVYDVTSRFNTAGNSITITPEAGNNYALYGAYLVVVYQDAGTTAKKIFINDEFDMVWSRSTYSTNNEEATVYANFTEVDNYNIASAKAIAILASASDVNKSTFFWNGNEYTGFWFDYQSNPQIGFSPYDVTGALTSGVNVAKLQSYDTAGNGDNMYAMNTILVAEYNTAPVSTIGIYRNGGFYLRNSNSAGNADNTFSYGLASDTPVVGDWMGSGKDTVGVYRNGRFYLASNNTNGGGTVNAFTYGLASDTPVVGDWNGDGTTTAGIFRNGAFYLASSNTNGGGTVNAFTYGQAGDIPVAGDWNGDGTTTTGIFRNGAFYLASSNTNGGGTVNAFTYGQTGDIPAVWNHDGKDTVGVYRNGVFYLASSNTNGGGTVNAFTYGLAGDNPVTGKWT